MADARFSSRCDVLSELTTSDLSNTEIAGLGTFLPGAGLGTTTDLIALGTFARRRRRTSRWVAT